MADAIGRKHVATLMRRMGIEALYQRANTPGAMLRMRSIPIGCVG